MRAFEGLRKLISVCEVIMTVFRGIRSCLKFLSRVLEENLK